MALDELLGASQSFINYMRGIREGKTDQITQATQQLNQFANTFANLQQTKLGGEELKLRQLENLQAQDLFPLKKQAMSLENQKLQQDVEAAKRKSENEIALSEFIVETAKEHGLTVPNVAPGDLDSALKLLPQIIAIKKGLLEEEATRKIEEARTGTEKVVSERKIIPYQERENIQKSIVGAQTLEAQKPYISREARAGVEAKEAGVEATNAQAQLDIAKAAAENIKGKENVNTLDWVRQLTTLVDMRNKLSVEKQETIDPMTYYVIQDDPEMTAYLTQALKNQPNRDKAITELDNLISGVRGILRQPPHNLNFDAMATWQKQIGTTLEEIPPPVGTKGTAQETQWPAQPTPQVGLGGTPKPKPTGTPGTIPYTPVPIDFTDETTFENSLNSLSSQYNVELPMAVAIIKAESSLGGNTFNKVSQEKRGNQSMGEGIVQMSHGTAAGMGVSPDELSNPDTNINTGFAYAGYLGSLGATTPDEFLKGYVAGEDDIFSDDSEIAGIKYPANDYYQYKANINSAYIDYIKYPENLKRDIGQLYKNVLPKVSQKQPAPMPQPKATPKPAPQATPKPVPKPTTGKPTGAKPASAPSGEAMSMYAGEPTGKPTAQPKAIPKAQTIDEAKEKRSLQTAFAKLGEIKPTDRTKYNEIIDGILSARQDGMSYEEMGKAIEKEKDGLTKKYGAFTYAKMKKVLSDLSKSKAK